MVAVDPVAEQVLSAAEDYRIDEQSVFVDEIVLHQQIDEGRAAVDNQLAAWLFLDASDLGDDVAREEGGVAPLGAGQRFRHHVLRDLVDSGGDVTGRRRGPEGSPDLECLPPQEKGIGAEDLGGVVFLVLLVLDSQGPGVLAVTVLVESGTLDDAIERHERSDDQSHQIHCAR